MKLTKIMNNMQMFSDGQGLTIYFSYETPIAFYDGNKTLVIRQNRWGPTTGKHLNHIDSNKEIRVNDETFTAELNSIRVS